ncbi:NAD(P)-dependent oxidoreductase [Allostreptomyces psammosilenae]|uniref:3-hydroxyisobutyrate dehydrogenase-like beta-hydroxyacid dehydrogenase n=1 Tax=Allostreptomyces psammosilenae TaxID=1892865 RepID=A0A852ZS03_9ACTN|nr:NAD(P)-binding domain-containing protein [Allostreptomyces psammosilenae]NYI04060.1 3-hydroxyisobutyrate dehydrogenase-like beta-hydroxyacid dehydrogenase [Allostreptomyces psammosilenae]
MNAHEDNAAANPVSVVGLGAMGQAIAAVLLANGHPTTVWNRSAGKADELVARGAVDAGTLGAAVGASPLVIACLLDHASVHEALEPVADLLSGRVLVNVTTTTAAEARRTAAWAAEHGIDYLDGAMIAVPQMIGRPGSSLLYSGSRTAFEQHRAMLDLLGASTYFGEDAGLASLYDLALLSGMYAMFGGFFHATAMVGTAGAKATEFVSMLVPWLKSMADLLPSYAEIIEKGDYTTDVQSLLFNKSAVDAIARTSLEQGIGVDMVAPVQALIDRQIAEGHGADSFVRVIEGIRNPVPRS